MYARVVCICACACACVCACGRGAPLVPPLTLGEASRTFPPSMPSIGSASSWSENCIGIGLGLGLRLALGTVYRLGVCLGDEPLALSLALILP